ncbi:hypothetical protein Btru_060313 [Bulinus truncatus]|nr:hypothetical protein Btru_060313 [Bulinus truncatus]
MSAQDKNSFHYRMCKKVAELTQVVHLLFTRNHEKEIEMAALKESYEYEIELVIQDAKSRIASLENSLEELKKQNLEIEQRSHKEIDVALSDKDAQWRQILLEKEKCFEKERIECQNLRGMLIKSQADIDKRKQNLADQIAAKNYEILRKDEEIQLIHRRLDAAEMRLNGSQINEQNASEELRRTNEKLKIDIIHLQSLADKMNKNNEQLLARNKQLEANLKDTKAQYNKKLSQVINKQNKDMKSLDLNEELDRLKQEVQRYRLELSNRDNNFTKMFCEKQPSLVIQRRKESQQKGMMSVDVSPSNGKYSLPYKIIGMNSSMPQSSSFTEERPSFLRQWEYERRQSKSISVEPISIGTECENLEKEQEFLKSYKRNKRSPNVAENGYNEKEAVYEQSSYTSKKLPSISATSEKNSLTGHLTKPKTPTNSSLFVK